MGGPASRAASWCTIRAMSRRALSGSRRQNRIGFAGGDLGAEHDPAASRIDCQQVAHQIVAGIRAGHRQPGKDYSTEAAQILCQFRSDILEKNAQRRAAVDNHHHIVARLVDPVHRPDRHASLGQRGRDRDVGRQHRVRQCRSRRDRPRLRPERRAGSRTDAKPVRRRERRRSLPRRRPPPWSDRGSAGRRGRAPVQVPISRSSQRAGAARPSRDPRSPRRYGSRPAAMPPS